MAIHADPRGAVMSVYRTHVPKALAYLQHLRAEARPRIRRGGRQWMGEAPENVRTHGAVKEQT
jgi:hypothetical protein